MTKRLILGGILLMMQFVSASQFVRTVPFDAKDCDSICMQDIYAFAKLSQGVYKKNDLIEWNGWVRVFVDENIQTGYRAAAYKNEQTRQLVIAFSGTDDLADQVTDLNQFLGIIPEQYKQGVDTVQQLLALVSNGVVIPEIGELLAFDVILTGHSLGGGIAQFVADIFQQRAVGFNSAPLSQSIVNGLPELQAQAKEEYPVLVGNESRILHIVSKTQSGVYDFVADSPGILLGETRFLNISPEIQDADPIHFSLHAIDTANKELDRFFNTADIEIRLVWEKSNTNLDLVLDNDLGETCDVNRQSTVWGCRYQFGDNARIIKEVYQEQQQVNLDTIILHPAIYSIKVIDKSEQNQGEIPITLLFYSHGEIFSRLENTIQSGEEKIVWQAQLGS